MNLLEISVDDLQDFLNDRKDKAHKTLREYIVFLRQVFDSAVEDKKMLFNPAKSKKLHNPSDKVTIRETLPLEVVQQILQDICRLDETERRLMALLLLTGMRRGEVLGLKWEDIDFEKKMISVRRNVTFPNNQPKITTPKTENGVRQVPVDDNLIALLDRSEHAKGYVIGGRKRSPSRPTAGCTRRSRNRWISTRPPHTSSGTPTSRFWMPQASIPRHCRASRGTGTSRSP